MFKIRNARPEDCSAIFELIAELALFERAPEKVTNTPESLLKDGFGEYPLYVCFVAESEGTVVGMSFCYIRYSTWVGKVLYLEDLLVTESQRGKGIGTALFQHTRDYAAANGFKRVAWQVLDWNIPAIEFYKKAGAELDAEWVNAWVETDGQ